MDSEFENLLLDFGTIMEALGGTVDLHTRRAMLIEANGVLSEARTVWQGEMRRLRHGIECLREASGETMRLAAKHDDTRIFSQIAHSEKRFQHTIARERKSQQHDKIPPPHFGRRSSLVNFPEIDFEFDQLQGEIL